MPVQPSPLPISDFNVKSRRNGFSLHLNAPVRQHTFLSHFGKKLFLTSM